MHDINEANRQDRDTQDVAANSPLNPQVELLIEKVMRAMYALEPEIADDHRFKEVPFEERKKYFHKEPLREEAESAILATLQGLGGFELPENIKNEGSSAAYLAFGRSPLTYARVAEEAFRAICSALASSMKEGGDV